MLQNLKLNSIVSGLNSQALTNKTGDRRPACLFLTFLSFVLRFIRSCGQTAVHHSQEISRQTCTPERSPDR